MDTRESSRYWDKFVGSYRYKVGVEDVYESKHMVGYEKNCTPIEGYQNAWHRIVNKNTTEFRDSIAECFLNKLGSPGNAYTYIIGIINNRITLASCLYMSPHEIGSKHIDIVRFMLKNAMDNKLPLLYAGEYEVSNDGGAVKVNVMSGTYMIGLSERNPDWVKLVHGKDAGIIGLFKRWTDAKVLFLGDTVRSLRGRTVIEGKTSTLLKGDVTLRDLDRLQRKGVEIEVLPSSKSCQARGAVGRYTGSQILQRKVDRARKMLQHPRYQQFPDLMKKGQSKLLKLEKLLKGTLMKEQLIKPLSYNDWKIANNV